MKRLNRIIDYYNLRELDSKSIILLLFFAAAFIIVADDLSSDLAQKNGELNFVFDRVKNVELTSVHVFNFSNDFLQPENIIIPVHVILVQNPFLNLSSDRAPPF